MSRGVLALGLAGVVLAAALGVATYRITRETLALPAVRVDAAAPLAPPTGGRPPAPSGRTRSGPPPPARTAAPPPPATPAPPPQRPPGATETETQAQTDGGGRGRNRGRGRGRGRSGEDD